MPELPEVERVRHTLAQHLPGRKVQRVNLARHDIVRGPDSPEALLSGDRIVGIERLGKQLALVGDSGRAVCVHLGMTGSLCWGHPGDRAAAGPRGPAEEPSHAATDVPDPHVHVTWHFDAGGALRFRDPRRFGGLWPYASVAALQAARWAALGPDALRVTPSGLCRRLGRTRRAVKAALLDQNLLAGLGNIYVDELLFACGIAPAQRADTLELATVQRLVRRMRTLLRRSIERGGTSFRDYVDGNGQVGGFRDHLRVYGRAGAPCRRCRSALEGAIVAGRMTVFCTRCQVETL